MHLDDFFCKSKEEKVEKKSSPKIGSSLSVSIPLKENRRGNSPKSEKSWILKKFAKSKEKAKNKEETSQKCI